MPGGGGQEKVEEQVEIKGEERRTEKEGNNRKQKVECSREKGELASSSCKLNIGPGKKTGKK